MSRSQTPDLDALEHAEQARALHAQRVKLLEEEKVAVLRVLMSDKVGRRFISLHLDDCKCREVPYSLNHAEVMRNEGRRSVGGDLYELIQAHCGEQWKLLETERVDDERQWRIETEQEAHR